MELAHRIPGVSTGWPMHAPRPKRTPGSVLATTSSPGTPLCPGLAASPASAPVAERGFLLFQRAGDLMLVSHRIKRTCSWEKHWQDKTSCLHCALQRARSYFELFLSRHCPAPAGKDLCTFSLSSSAEAESETGRLGHRLCFYLLLM